MELIQGAFLPPAVRGYYTGAMKRSWRLFSRKEVTRKIPSAGVMKLRPWEFIEARLFFYRVWEPEITRFMRACVQAGDVAIDVGANIGYYTLLLGAGVGAGGKVYAAEPSPSIRARLEENIALNNLGNVAVLPYGISNKSEDRYLRLSDTDNSGESRFVDDPDQPNIEGKLPLRRLVDLIPGEDMARTSLIKVDVEGMEIEVLGDILDTLDRFPRRLAICAELRRFSEQGDDADRLIARFREAGFQLYRFDNRYGHADYARGDSRPPERVESLSDGQHDVAFVRS